MPHCLIVAAPWQPPCHCVSTWLAASPFFNSAGHYNEASGGGRRQEHGEEMPVENVAGGAAGAKAKKKWPVGHRRELAELRAVMPEGLAKLDLPRGLGWEDALAVMQEAGFVCHSRAVLKPRDWSGWAEGDDIPEPIKDIGREFALLSHPAGFFVEMNSYLGGIRRGRGEIKSPFLGQKESVFDREYQELNSLEIHYKLKAGVHASPPRSSSAQIDFDPRPLCDGGWLLEGSWKTSLRVGNVREVLDDCYRNGAPVPLRQWGPTSVWLDSGHYSQAEIGGSAADYESDRAFFKNLLARDFSALIAQLPPKVAEILKYSGPDRASMNAPEALRDLGRNIDANWTSYIGGERIAGGLSILDAETMSSLASWAQSLFNSRRGEEFVVDEPARTLCGSNILHAIASLAVSEPSIAPCRASGAASRRRRARPLLTWLERQSAEAVREWAGASNASGKIPAQVALERRMAGDGSDLMDDGVPAGLLPWLCSRGLLGEPWLITRDVLRILDEVESYEGPGQSYNSQRVALRGVEVFKMLQSQAPGRWASRQEWEGQEAEALVFLAKRFECESPGWLTALAEQEMLAASVGAGACAPSKAPRI